MIQVTFYTGLKRQLGFATFPSLSIDKRTDYSCSPTRIISLASAQQITAAIRRGEVAGEVEGMEWRLDQR